MEDKENVGIETEVFDARAYIRNKASPSDLPIEEGWVELSSEAELIVKATCPICGKRFVIDEGKGVYLKDGRRVMVCKECGENYPDRRVKQEVKIPINALKDKR